MKRMNLVFVVLFLISLTWAMYEKSSKSTLSQKVQRLESEYLKKTKDSDFLQDKANSLEEKIGVLVKEKDELFKNDIAKDEYAASLEKKLENSLETINQLKQRMANLEKILAAFQEGVNLPKKEE